MVAQIGSAGCDFNGGSLSMAACPSQDLAAYDVATFLRSGTNFREQTSRPDIHLSY
jgi:hypothetical protein